MICGDGPWETLKFQRRVVTCCSSYCSRIISTSFAFDQSSFSILLQVQNKPQVKKKLLFSRNTGGKKIFTRAAAILFNQFN